MTEVLDNIELSFPLFHGRELVRRTIPECVAILTAQIERLDASAPTRRSTEPNYQIETLNDQYELPKQAPVAAKAEVVKSASIQTNQEVVDSQAVLEAKALEALRQIHSQTPSSEELISKAQYN